MMKRLDRRTFLRGMGTAVALPALESMTPRAKAATQKPPLRMGFVYMPNGVIMKDWRPEGVGENYTLSKTLKSLEPVKSQIQILSGLDHYKAAANGDGAGDHARANATFLTGVQARKTKGSDIELGISVDQLAAQQIGNATRLPSLELSCDASRKSGGCDSGYSCAYQFNLSWSSKKTPVPAEVNPRSVFERLFSDNIFGKHTADADKRRRYNKSVLDFVREDARRLQGQLGYRDGQKLDEYLSSIRDIEKRIEYAENITQNLPEAKMPTGIPKAYKDHLRLMFDLQVLAFETDTTRIGTFMMAHDGSNRSFPEIGVPDGHHHISHHQNNQVKMEKIQKIDQFYIEQFSYFLERLKAIDENGSSLLDNVMIVCGSGISDGNRHAHYDLPVILAGGGGGTFKPGRHVEFDKEVPMTNLYLAMLRRMGVKTDQLGDSDGVVQNV
jgi:hypothetical protein